LFDQWSLKELLSHLTGWAKYQINLLERLEKGKQEKLQKSLKNSINIDFVLTRREYDWKKAYQEFLNSSESLIKKYELLPEKLWKEKVYKDKEITSEEFIKIEIKHYIKTHGPQIKKVLKQLNLS